MVAGNAQALSTEGDDRLIEKAKEDPEAFGALYQKYLALVYNYIFYRVHNVHEAEDLTAKTFYQAVFHLRRYTNQGVPFSAWLFRIAHNLVANWHRDRQRRKTYSLEAMAPGWHQEAEIASLSEGMERKERAQWLKEAIGRLSAERQQLLLLKFVDGLSNAEIATIMGRTEGAIKALLHRTLFALRQEIGGRGDEARDEPHLMASSGLASSGLMPEARREER